MNRLVLFGLLSLFAVDGRQLATKPEINEFCKFPSSLWCSSLRIAQQCQVVQQCKENALLKEFKLSGSDNEDDRVKFALYHETLCPDCQQFIQNQLWPTFKKIGDIIDLDIIPYGNAREEWDGSKWKFTCQHGEKECLGNLIQTCAIHLAGSVNTTFPFIACMEMSGDTDSCARKHGIDMTAVMSCVDGPLGNKLEHEMAEKTDKLTPAHEYVPWVTLDGEHTDEIAERAEKDLLGLICESYKSLDSFVDIPTGAEDFTLVQKFPRNVKQLHIAVAEETKICPNPLSIQIGHKAANMFHVQAFVL